MMKPIFLVVILTLSLSVFANHIDRCIGNFVSTADKKTELERWLQAKAEHPNTLIYQKYKAFLEAHPNAMAPYLQNFAYDVMLDLEMLSTAKSFEKVLDDLKASLESHPGLSADDRLRQVVTNHLQGKVPEHSIPERVNEFMNGGSVYRALGEMNKEEVAYMFHGGNPLQPTADSKLGKFIAKHQAATTIKKFKHGEPVYQGEGPEKLVVALDANSINDFVELMKDEHLFAHYHTPNQGTLQVLHNDDIVNWRGKSANFTDTGKNFGEAQEGMLLPTIFLSSTESQRMTQFMTAMKDHELYEFAQKPWNLQGYCATGGYNSCTHWFGNIPIGDEKVATYTFPGNVDNAAGNAPKLEGEADKLPRTQDLVNWEFPANTQLSDTQKALIKRIWKNPGNKQLSYTLGIGKAQERGELANPGWVVQVLMSRLKQDRSPVVFLFTGNAREPIPADLVLKVSPQ